MEQRGEQVIDRSGDLAPDFASKTDLGGRCVARVIDMALLAVAGLALYGIGGSFPSSFESWTAQSISLFSAAIVGLYEVGCIAVFGRTIGKRVMGLTVVDRSNGSKPSVLQAVVRWVVYDIALLVTLVLGQNGTIGILPRMLVIAPALRGPLHLGIHDYASRTIVIKAAPNE